MPIPLWIPLATLIGAMAKSESDRPANGPPQRKSFFDMVAARPELDMVTSRLQVLLEAHPNPTYEFAARSLHREMGLRPDDPTVAGTLLLLYMAAHGRRWNANWLLDEDAVLMLANTDVPWHVVQERLPRLPVPTMHIRLPEGLALPVELKGVPQRMRSASMPDSVPVRSIVLHEEIPGVLWRYLGSSDDKSLSDFRFTNGKLDTKTANAKALLEGTVRIEPDFTYADSGEDVIWKMLINLMLALENNHLEGQKVQPKPSKNKKRAEREQKRANYSPYTVVRLSRSSNQERTSQSRASSSNTRSTRRHLRTGHWRSAWVTDPGDRPIYGVKPRLGRDGRELDGHLYRVVNWIFPHWVGEGQPMQKNVIVRKG